MKQLVDFMDSYGFIGHGAKPDLEFGDGTQRTGTWWIDEFIFSEEHIRKAFSNTLLMQTKDITRENNEPTRHWDKNKWPGQSGIMSRDNFTPWAMALGLYGSYNKDVKEMLKGYLKTLWKRCGFLWNTKHIWPKPEDKWKLPDFMFPWALFNLTARTLNLWWLFPLVWVFDLELVVMAIIRVIAGKIDKDDTGDDLNTSLQIIYGQLRIWSPVVYVAKLIYKLRDPVTAWYGYFAPETAPPLAMKVERTLRKYL